MDENTSFDTVYEQFLMEIRDTELAQLSSKDLNEELERLLTKALGYFTNLKDYDLDTMMGEFTRTLTQLEINILVSAMVLVWLAPRVNNTNLLTQRMSDRDYTVFSGAKHIDSLIALHQKAERNFHYWSQRYSLENFKKDNQ